MKEFNNVMQFFGFFLIPYVGLLFLIELFENKKQLKEYLYKTALSFILWFLIAFAVFTLLWPAMWVAPAETLGWLGRSDNPYAIYPSMNRKYMYVPPLDLLQSRTSSTCY